MQRSAGVISREDRAEIMDVVRQHRADRGDIESARLAHENAEQLRTMDEWCRR